MHQFTPQRPDIHAVGQMIRETYQQALLYRLAVQRLLTHVESLASRDIEELFVQRPDLPRCLRVDTEPATALDVESVPLGVPPRSHQHKKI
jgi:hypothetical protein